MASEPKLRAYGGNRLQHVQPATDQVDAGSRLGKGESNCCSHASSASGDNGYLALKSAHLRPHVTSHVLAEQASSKLSGE